MITLGIDTTAVAASAALVKDGKLLGEMYANVGLQHSRTLMPMVESLLNCCGISPMDIDRFGVTAGPGSFTGVRIGVAAVKGMALPATTPCIELSTLEVLAHNIPFFEGIICPVMDARCNQVYNALFCLKDGEITRLCQDRAIAIDELQNELAELNQPVLWVGDGANLCFDALENTDHHTLAPEALRYQRASVVALLAERSNKTVFPESLQVSYLRPPQAVRVRENK